MLEVAPWIETPTYAREEVSRGSIKQSLSAPREPQAGCGCWVRWPQNTSTCNDHKSRVLSPSGSAKLISSDSVTTSVFLFLDSLILSTTVTNIALHAQTAISSNDWVLNSGANDHYTSKSQSFSSTSIILPGDNGGINISPKITLNNVLHVPNFAFNLFYVSKPAKTPNCLVIFLPSSYLLHDLSSRNIFGRGMSMMTSTTLENHHRLQLCMLVCCVIQAVMFFLFNL